MQYPTKNIQIAKANLYEMNDHGGIIKMPKMIKILYFKKKGSAVEKIIATLHPA